MNDSQTGETSLQMLAAAQVGQDSAWRQIVDRYGRRVYRWCRCCGLQPADASNVTQEVFRTLARKLPEFERGEQVGSFRSWVRTITRNKIHDHYRAQKRQMDVARGGTDAHLHLGRVAQPSPGAAPGEMPGELPNEMEEPQSDVGRLPRSVPVGRLAQVRKEFSERDWRFFWRLVVDGQTAVDVAHEFGVTANTVRLVKMRVLRRLRESFNVIPLDPPSH